MTSDDQTEKAKPARWHAFLDKHFREFATVMLFLLGALGSYLVLKMDAHVVEMGDKRWLQTQTYLLDRATDKSEREMDRQKDASSRQATDKELAAIRQQNDRTQLSIERSQLETKDSFNRMADLIEKLRKP